MQRSMSSITQQPNPIGSRGGGWLSSFFVYFFTWSDPICLQLSIPHDFFFSFNWPRSDLVDVNRAMIELPVRRPVSYALSFS
jgi:hypothetical protein